MTAPKVKPSPIPVSFEQFKKNPVAAVAFCMLLAVSYLYMDLRSGYKEQIEKSNQKIDALDIKIDRLSYALKKSDSALAAAITAVCALVMGMVPGFAAWGAARVLQGVGFGLLFASAESWLGQAVPINRRGDMMGFYYFLSRIAGLLAPFLAFGMSALDPRGLSWVSILLCLSLATLCLTRQEEPAPPAREVMRRPQEQNTRPRNRY
jgi:MFS-type transporter involved in bile tolerance (Atg22 family)